MYHGGGGLSTKKSPRHGTPDWGLHLRRQQGSFVLIDVRSDEKTARRAVVLARNADKHDRSRDARSKPFF